MAIFGDFSGLLPPPQRGLSALGLFPQKGESLWVAHAGDLGLNKGHDLDAIIEMVDPFVMTPDPFWVQIIGNWEARDLQIVGNSKRHSSPANQKRMLEWIDMKRAVPATSFTLNGTGDVLMTHAGMSRHVWEYLDRPATAGSGAPLHSPPERLVEPALVTR